MIRLSRSETSSPARPLARRGRSRLRLGFGVFAASASSPGLGASAARRTAWRPGPACGRDRHDRVLVERPEQRVEDARRSRRRSPGGGVPGPRAPRADRAELDEDVQGGEAYGASSPPGVVAGLPLRAFVQVAAVDRVCVIRSGQPLEVGVDLLDDAGLPLAGFALLAVIPSFAAPSARKISSAVTGSLRCGSGVIDGRRGRGGRGRRRRRSAAARRGSPSESRARRRRPARRRAAGVPGRDSNVASPAGC